MHPRDFFDFTSTNLHACGSNLCVAACSDYLQVTPPLSSSGQWCGLWLGRERHVTQQNSWKASLVALQAGAGAYSSAQYSNSDNWFINSE